MRQASGLLLYLLLSGNVAWAGHVLNPARFYGGARHAYQVASQNEELISNLFCYCGCDKTDHHKRLIDCFTSKHAVDCGVCQREAIEGARLKAGGMPLAMIQRKIDRSYNSYYDGSPSRTLMSYRASREAARTIAKKSKQYL